jgi:hypothetical protein
VPAHTIPHYVTNQTTSQNAGALGHDDARFAFTAARQRLQVRKPVTPTIHFRKPAGV